MATMTVLSNAEMLAALHECATRNPQPVPRPLSEDDLAREIWAEHRAEARKDDRMSGRDVRAEWAGCCAWLDVHARNIRAT